VHQFFMGLDDVVYGTVRSNLLAANPLPSLNRIYSTMIQEDRVRTITRAKEERGKVMGLVVQVVKNRGRGEFKDRSMFCTNCNRSGHDTTDCFQLVGYPDWWGDRPKTEGRSSARGKGQHRGAGRGRGPVVVRANATQTSTSSSTANTEKNGFLGITSEQWQKLMEMLNTHPPDMADKMTGKSPRNSWILDSGASNHMTGNLNFMCDLHEIQAFPVGMPNGQNANATKEGLVLFDGGFKLSNVLYVPNLQCNLISLSQLMDDLDCIVHFVDKLCVLQDRISRTLIGAGERRDGLYYFRTIQRVQACKVVGVNQLELWHRRLGHPSLKITQLVSNSSKNKEHDHLNKNCDVCLRAKQTRDKFSLSEHVANDVFELIHCDLWGPYRTTSSCGAFYFMTIVDDYSRAVWIYLIADKREVSQTLMNFFTLINRQFGKHVKIFRSDNGTKFICMKRYFHEHGIIFQTSCVGTPQQNERVEGKHRHILNIARALRFQGNLPIDFWGECVLTAGYLMNRTPSVVLNSKTPYEMLYGQAPSLEHLRVFGCLCYAHNQNRKEDKFSSRSRKCIFIGYLYGKKGWKLFDLESKQQFVSRDVEFVETDYPFVGNLDTTPNITFNPILSDDDVVLDEEQLDERANNGTVILNSDQGEATSGDRGVEEAEVENHSNSEPLLEIGMELASEQDEATELLGRGYRHKFPSTRLRDCVTHTVQKMSPSSHSPTPSSSSGTAYPIAHYANLEKFSLAHRAFLAGLDHDSEPTIYNQAVKDLKWREAMKSEIQALEKNGTWTITHLPPGKKTLGCKWVYKVKHKSDGTVERYKARLVILGNRQVEGVDYNETFAPVAKMVTVQTILAVAAVKNWELHQMDVHNAFLHGDLQEEVFMKPPPGFHTTRPGIVCKLHKSLYGLKQAPRCWFAKMSTALKVYGFKQSLSDYSLFILQQQGSILVVLVYVDDLIISGNDHAVISAFKTYLHTCFHMKDLGILKYFLGVEVARSPTGILLCQRKYALDIISEAGLLGSKPAPTPLEQNHHLALANGRILDQPDKYRRLVGRLIYLCFTRPELSYCVHILYQFMQQPKQEHWEVALRVVCYLKGNPGQGILLRHDSPLQLNGWCDSDWASCPLTRRSLTGWLFFSVTHPYLGKPRSNILFHDLLLKLSIGLWLLSLAS